jgi:two-component system NtrC family response regulator
MKPKLLVVDDEEEIRLQMKWALVRDYEVLFAEDRNSAGTVFRENRPAVVLLDLGLPPNPNAPDEGLETLYQLLAIDKSAKVIIITGQSDRDNALKAVGEGAYDFLNKPIDMDELLVILKRAFYLAQLERDNQKMREQLNDEAFEGMLGTSPQMQDVFNTIRKIATSDATIVILGESGTGKEMAAQAIHRRSQRRSGPFIAINCGAIPENLLESELFGHEKGAFTGAHIQRAGRIELANGGTLFLDEIGEMPPSLQVKILRYLQDQTIERIGGRESIRVDARVIVATNVDLKKAMSEGRFREDLYYRLAVVELRMPALRERSNDIAMLAQSFLLKFSAKNGKEPPRFTQDAMRAIEQYSWPGNVRELENRVKRAVIMCEGARVNAADLELSDKAGVGSGRSLKEAREAVEIEMLQKALRKHNGKISRAAAELGISRPTLYELMDKLGMRKTEDSA